MPDRQPTLSSEKTKTSIQSASFAVGSVPRFRRLLGSLNQLIFLFLCLFAILLPHSIKGSQHAWQIALLLWMMALALGRRRPIPQPLSGPLLAFVVFSGISTALSPDPYLSWDRMKVVCLLLVGIVVAQNLSRM